MTGAEFKEFMSWSSSDERVDYIQPCVRVRMINPCQGDIGVCMRLCESLSSEWRSGQIICFWGDGDHTTIDDTDELEVLDDVWSIPHPDVINS
jgi:hypothetical protein